MMCIKCFCTLEGAGCVFYAQPRAASSNRGGFVLNCSLMRCKVTRLHGAWNLRLLPPWSWLNEPFNEIIFFILAKTSQTRENSPILLGDNVGWKTVPERRWLSGLPLKIGMRSSVWGSDLWPVLQDVACECGEEGGHAQRPACTERRSEANADNTGRAGRVQEPRWGLTAIDCHVFPAKVVLF